MSTSKSHVGQDQGPGGQCADCFVRPLTARVGIVVKLQLGRWGRGGDKIFRRVLLAFREQKTCLQVFKFSCLQAFCSEKGGQNNKGNEALPGEREGIRAGCCDPTASMPLRSFGEAVCHRCSFARRMRRCQC